MSSEPLIIVEQLTHRYGERVALDRLDLTINRGELFTILGPNGGGKTTLFRVLSTLLRPQLGRVSIFGKDLVTHAASIRSQLGIIFQAPSLDKKLTVAENLWCQGRLYGIERAELKQRTSELLTRFGLADRANERAEKLSGGQKRRVELAKGLLHRPKLLLLDEPSTGLDPLVRVELWKYLQEMRSRDDLTIVLTTHLLEEADKADRLAILDQGKLVALDTPSNLKSSVAGETLCLTTDTVENAAAAARVLSEKFPWQPKVLQREIRVELPDAHHWIAPIVEALPGKIESLTLSKPSLEDVFIARTGHHFLSEIENN